LIAGEEKEWLALPFMAEHKGEISKVEHPMSWEVPSSQDSEHCCKFMSVSVCEGYTQVVFFSFSLIEQEVLQGNPSRCKTQICTKPIGVEVHLPQWFSVPILRAINENYPLQPPPKLGVKKIDGPKTHQIDWEWPQNFFHKAISTINGWRCFGIILNRFDGFLGHRILLPPTLGMAAGGSFHLWPVK